MAALLVMQCLLMLAIAVFGDLSRHVPIFLFLFAVAATIYLLALRLARFDHVSLRTVLVWAVLLRLPMFIAPPSLSDDVWRYIHDGRAQNAGVNPYRYAPSDPATAAYRGPDFNRINHPDLPTIYPPLAQLAFRIGALAPSTLLVWRLLLLAAEIAIVLAAATLIRRRNGNIANLAIYAWHPLAILETIGSGHLDSLGIAFMVGALAIFAAGSAVGTGAALAASVATKLVAAPLLVLMARNAKTVLAFGLVLGLLYLPFIMDGTNALGSLGAFADRWESNGSLHALLAPLIGQRIYRWLALVILVSAIALMRVRKVEILDAALMYFLLLFLLAPVVHPWYLLWLLATLALREKPFDTRGLAAMTWTITVVLAYVAHHEEMKSGVWRVPAGILILEYAAVYIFSMMYLMPRLRNIAAKMYRNTFTSVR